MRQGPRGQAIVEYLVIAVAIITALVAAWSRLGQSANALYDTAKRQIDGSASGVENLSLTGGKVFGN